MLPFATRLHLSLLLVLTMAVAPTALHAQARGPVPDLPEAGPGGIQQPMRITVTAKPGPDTVAANEKVRQAALKSGGAMTPEKARAALSDRTNMTFGADYTAPPMKRYDVSGHLVSETPAKFTRGSGTQVEYVAAGGKSYLWYPANPAVVQGVWTLEENSFRLVTDQGFAIFNLVNLCFHYTPSGPGPGAVGGASCSPAYMYLQRVRESVGGDIFGLSRRPAPPFVLDRDQTTLAALRQKAGGR